MAMAMKEAELGNLLHLSTVSNEGKVWHTIRYESGNWAPFIDIEGEAGEIGYPLESSLQFMGGPVHLCVVNGSGTIFHTYRRPDGTWLPFEDVKIKAGDPGLFDRLTIGATGGFRDGQLHIFGSTTFNKLYYAILKADGVTWVNFVDVEDASRAGEIGQVFQVACTGDVYPSAYDLHLCATTVDGKLWHTIRGGDGKWIHFEDVEARGAGDRGKFVNVDCEMVGQELHIVGRADSGKLWHTVRDRVTGNYSSFQEVGGGAGDPSNIRGVALGGSNGMLQLAVVSNDRIYHSIRDPRTGKFGPFGDVLTQAGELAPIVSVGVHGLYVF